MNYENVLNGIVSAIPSSRQNADTYIAYLRKLESEKKKDGNQYVLANSWLSRMSDQKAIDLYKKVAAKGLTIDGDSVTIQQRGGEIMPEYDYTAYKNLVMKKYPETRFDWGIVYQGDSFSFRKECGKVIYTHVISNPFDTARQIIGAYGIIKNSTGEFLETINTEDIRKFRNTAKAKNIWETWFDRMVLKSIIKRICHTAFKDEVESIEKEDNENYDLDMVNINCKIQSELAACQTVPDVKAFYDKYLPKTKNANELVAICAKRKTEIMKSNDEA